jgi:hypothetical protein
MTKSDVPSEIAWLIELPQHARPGKPPTYWGHVEESEGWTRDANEAIRFDTQEGADRYGSDIGLLDYEVVEHAWVTMQS